MDCDPNFMVWSATNNLLTLSLVQVHHGLGLIQYCPNAKPPTEIISYPHDQIARLNGEYFAGHSAIFPYVVPYDYIGVNSYGELQGNEV